MALRVWLPLTGTLENKGISNLQFTNEGATVNTAGKIGSCYTFNNNRIYTSVTTDFTSQFNTEASLSIWIKLSTSHNAWAQTVTFGTLGTNWNDIKFGIDINGNGTVYASSSTGSSYTNVASTTNIKDNIWHHIAITYKDTTLKVYIDGLLSNTRTTAVTPAWSSCNLITIGGNSSEKLKNNDSLNDFRVYNHCLSAAEVHEISQGLVLHYKLDGFQGGFGNPNLVTGSNTNSTSTNRWFGHSAVGGNTSTIVTDENGHQCVQVARDSTTQSSWDYLSYDNLIRNQIKTNTTYTVSFDCKPSVDGSIGFSGFLNGNATNSMMASTSTIQGTCYANQWNHMIYRGVTKASFEDISVSGQVVYFGRSASLRGVNTTVLFKNIKVEEGTVDTPWCPADSELTIDRTHIQDSSGYGHNGTINGNPSLTGNTLRYSQCMEFHANTTDYITIPTTTLDMTNITFSAWAKWKTFNTWSRVFDFGEKASGAGYSFLVANNGSNLVVAGRRSGGASLPDTTIMTIATNTWYHICVTIVDTTCKTYVNGELKKTFTLNGSIGNALYNLNYLGKSNWSADGKYDGYINDFRIYTTALNATDVLSLYNTAAKIDNLGGLHTFELNENGSNKLTKTGIFKDYIVEPFITLSDGSKWQMLMFHYVDGGNNLFKSTNAAYCNDFGLYSRLQYIDNFTYDGKYEFYAIQDGTPHRWTQTNAPLTTTSVANFTVVSGSPGGGICKCNGNTLLARTNTTSNWWDACGCWTKYSTGIPGFNGDCKYYLALYARISEPKFHIANLTAYANNLIER